MDVFTVIIGFLIICLLVLVKYLTKNYGYLESMNIPVIKPFLCFGSPPLSLHKIVWHQWYLEQHQKLGLTWGQYIGQYSIIVTIDPDIIKAVFVSNFDVFTDTMDSSGFKDRQMTMDMASGETWRALRKTLSPTFSSGRLKIMMKPMGEVCDKTMKHLETLAEQNQVVEIKSVFQGYALDTICKCAFGIDTNAHQNQDDNQLIKAGRGVFQGLICHNWGETIFTMLFSFFPGLEKCINMFPESWDKLFDITENIISEREATSSNVHRHGDFIDRIMEVRNDPNAEVSKDLVTAQGIAFFAAGFETTSNCLSTLCYNLVQNPEIQDRIFEEIREVLESHDCIDHESIAEMNYLEAAINENLRMYPPANLQDRIASQDIEIKGMKIKKGTFVRMPIYASHHNPDFFPDPEMFKPERFLKEYADHDLIPYTWRPFSGGPRICIGLRFAMTEMKICMAKLLVKFQLEQCLETKLEFEPGDQFMLNFADVKLKLIKRT